MHRVTVKTSIFVIVRKPSHIMGSNWIKSIYMIHEAIKDHQEENDGCYSMHSVIKVILVYVNPISAFFCIV